MTKKILFYLYIILVFGCKEENKEIVGSWFSTEQQTPCLIINDQTITISNACGLFEYNYKLRNNEIILGDSIRIITKCISISKWKKEKYYISKVLKDTLFIKAQYDENTYHDYKLVRKSLLDKTSFKKIQLLSSDGWDINFVAEIDSLGYLFVEKPRSFNKLKRSDKQKINPLVFDDILLYSNYIFKNSSFKTDYCKDCLHYCLTFYRNDTIKSLTFSNGNSILGFVTTQIDDLVTKIDTQIIDSTNVIKLIPRYSGRDTLIIDYNKYWR